MVPRQRSTVRIRGEIEQWRKGLRWVRRIVYIQPHGAQPDRTAFICQVVRHPWKGMKCVFVEQEGLAIAEAVFLKLERLPLVQLDDLADVVEQFLQPFDSCVYCGTRQLFRNT